MSESGQTRPSGAPRHFRLGIASGIQRAAARCLRRANIGSDANWRTLAGCRPRLPARSLETRGNEAPHSRHLIPLHFTNHGRGRRGRDDLVVLEQFTAQLANFLATQYHASHTSQRPYLGRPMKLHVKFRVGANSPASSIAASAGPMVSSSMAARNPPCTFPAGFRNSGFASNFISTVPRLPSIWTNSKPSVLSQGDSGSRPSTIFHKNEFLSMTLLPICPDHAHRVRRLCLDVLEKRDRYIGRKRQVAPMRVKATSAS